MSMGELFRSDYYVVEHRQGEPFVRVVRTDRAFAAIAHSVRANEEIAVALRKTSARRVLMDLRAL